MSVSIESIQECLIEAFGEGPRLTEKSVTFSYVDGASRVLISIRPEDLLFGQQILDSACVMMTFCQEDGNLINLKPLDEDLIMRTIGTLTESSCWGRVRSEIVNDDLMVLSLYRYISLSYEDLISSDDDYTKPQLISEIDLLYQEWLELSNILSIMFSGDSPVVIQRNVELLLKMPQGTCQ